MVWHCLVIAACCCCCCLLLLLLLHVSTAVDVSWRHLPWFCPKSGPGAFWTILPRSETKILSGIFGFVYMDEILLRLTSPVVSWRHLPQKIKIPDAGLGLLLEQPQCGSWVFLKSWVYYSELTQLEYRIKILSVLLCFVQPHKTKGRKVEKATAMAWPWRLLLVDPIPQWHSYDRNIENNTDILGILGASIGVARMAEIHQHEWMSFFFVAMVIFNFSCCMLPFLLFLLLSLSNKATWATSATCL